MIENITALGLVAILILLTDRWVRHFYRAFTEHLKRSEAAHLTMIKLLKEILQDPSDH